MIDERDTLNPQSVITTEIKDSILDTLKEGEIKSGFQVKELESQLLDLLIQRNVKDREIPPFFKGSIRKNLPPLSFYKPPVQKTIPPLRQGINGVLGVLFGAILFRPLFSALGLNSGATFFLSSIVGAFLFLYYQTKLASYPKFKNILAFILGTREEKIKKEELKASIEKTLALWIPLAQHKIQYQLAMIEREEASLEHQEMQELLPSLYRLHQSSEEELEVALLDLFAELKLLGYRGLEREPFFKKKRDEELYFQWSEDSQDQYSCFGHIEEGELVRVERPVIIQNKTIIQRGLVRKIHNISLKREV